MYTGDQAEARLDETINELYKLKVYTVEQAEIINNTLEQISSSNSGTFQTKFNFFIELSEKLSWSSMIVEELYEHFHNHGF